MYKRVSLCEPGVSNNAASESSITYMYANIPTQVCHWRNAFQTLLHLNPSPAAENCWSVCNLAITTLRSASVKNLAVSGKSTTSQKLRIPDKKVKRPIKMKIHLQPE